MLILAPTTLIEAQSRRPGAAQLTCPEPALPLAPTSPEPCGFKCGSERWGIKTLTDVDRGSVNFKAIPTTIQALNRLARPARRPAARRLEQEKQVYCVEAWLVDLRPQEDGDLHLELVAIDDTTAKLIAEVPDVRCRSVCTSTYATAFDRARTAIEQRWARLTAPRLRIRVTGVAFFDRNHGQHGAARNFIELHPILAVSFP